MFGFGKNKKHSSGEQSPIETLALDEASVEAGWLGKLKQGLHKSSSRFNEGVKDVFVRKRLDDQTLEALEDLLITSDLGASTAAYICKSLAKTKYDKEITAEEVKTAVAEEIVRLLDPVAKPLKINGDHKPQVIVMAGVNGTGKTTTIGKLASHYQQQGLSVMMAACDTFRAAAVEQLKVWSERCACPIVTGQVNADPASVAYEALEKAVGDKVDVLLIDTAGRLQNKTNLMEQLVKIIRVIKKVDDSAPHHCVLVLDATTGQNANSQVKVFADMIDISGIIVTKLDGTAKGGVVVGLAKEFALPIHAIGVGEGIEDLRHFKAKDFAESLVQS